MRPSICFILSSMATAYARNFNQNLQLSYVRKDIPFSNITTTGDAKFTSTSSHVTNSVSPWTSTSSTSVLTVTVTTSSEPPNLPTTTTSSQGSPPLLPTYPNTTTTEPTCIGVVTYSGSVPPTVFLTVTEGFDVTITASNDSVTASATLVTPLPACASTVVPAFGQPEPVAASYSKSAPEGHSRTAAGAQPDFASGDSDNSATQTMRPIYSSAAYTSTIIVTKKTPVTVLSPPTSVSVNFRPPNPPTTTGASNTARPPATTTGGSGGSVGGDRGPNNNRPPSGGQDGPPVTGSGPDSPAPNNPVAKPDPSIPGSSTGLGIGNIIASIIYSRILTPTTAMTRSTTINGVPVVILPSTVVIDGQGFAIPDSGTTSVQVDGVGFELRPTAIIAPSATITLAPLRQDQAMAVTPRPASTTVTAKDGLTFTVGQTVAIVSGTTYRVGPGASSTTVTVDGIAISIGPNGVELPRTTVTPLAATASGYVLYDVEGITFSVDDNEAVVSGTTYRVGANAPQMTTVVGGETISFGPGGIGLHSTTIVPTSVPRPTGSELSAGASDSASSDSNSAASGKLRIPFSEMLGWYLMGTALFYHVIS